MKFIFLGWRWLTAPAHRLISLTLLYYAATYFVNANIWLLALTAAYLAGLLAITQNFTLSLWLALLATLPLAKGKTLPLTLIPKTQLTAQHAVFDINYIFSFYLADGILGLLLWQLIKRWRGITALPAPWWQSRALGLTWAGFLLVVLVPQWHNSFSIVVVLSALQLGKLTLLFCLPGWLKKLHLKNFLTATAQVLLAGLLFQAAWSAAQYWQGGPLGRYLEAVLPIGVTNSAASISTSENRDVLRVTGTFFDPSLLGTYLFTLLAWVWTQRHQINQPKWLIWGTVAVGVMTLILTSNRILIGLLGLAIFGIIRQHRPNWQTIKKLWQSKAGVWLSVLVGVGLLCFTPYLWLRFQSLNTVFDRYGSATYRLQLGWYTLRLGWAQPWGVGLNLSPYFLATGFNQETVSFDPAHPHNIFLQLWAETGWAGVLCILGFLYLLYRPVVLPAKPPAKSKKSAGPHQSPLDWQLTAWGWGGLAFLACAQFYPVFINQIEVVSWLALMLGGHWASRQSGYNKSA